MICVTESRYLRESVVKFWTGMDSPESSHQTIEFDFVGALVRTVISVLQYDAEAVSCVSEDVNDAGVEDRNPLVAGTLPSLEDNDGSAGLVVPIVEPVPLLPGMSRIGEVVQRLSEIVLGELGGALAFGNRGGPSGSQLHCKWVHRGERPHLAHGKRDRAKKEETRPHLGGAGISRR